MLSIPPSMRIMVACDPVDFRRAFDGLCAIARDVLDEDPFAGHLFVFFNKRRDRIKLLLWDRNGFWMFYKRLEKGTFAVLDRARAQDRTHCQVDARELRLLLEGIDMKAVRFRRHFASGVRMSVRSDGRASTSYQGADHGRAARARRHA